MGNLIKNVLKVFTEIRNRLWDLIRYLHTPPMMNLLKTPTLYLSGGVLWKFSFVFFSFLISFCFSFTINMKYNFYCWVKATVCNHFKQPTSYWTAKMSHPSSVIMASPPIPIQNINGRGLYCLRQIKSRLPGFNFWNPPSSARDCIKYQPQTCLPFPEVSPSMNSAGLSSFCATRITRSVSPVTMR